MAFASPRTLVLAVALTTSPTLRLSAQGNSELLLSRNSCYVSGGLNACASLTLHREDLPPFPHPNSFVAALFLEASNVAFRVTGWGLYLPQPSNVQFTETIPEDGWSTNFPPAGWDDPGFLLRLGLCCGPPYEESWDFAVGGPHFFGAGFWGFWEGGSFPADVRFAWRGVTEDQSFTFDCIEQAPGSSECVSVAPEPSTWALLLTGFVVLTLASCRRFKRSAAPGRTNENQ